MKPNNIMSLVNAFYEIEKILYMNDEETRVWHLENIYFDNDENCGGFIP